jgi:hypothetical protein
MDVILCVIVEEQLRAKNDELLRAKEAKEELQRRHAAELAIKVHSLFWSFPSLLPAVNVSMKMKCCLQDDQLEKQRKEMDDMARDFGKMLEVGVIIYPLTYYCVTNHCHDNDPK